MTTLLNDDVQRKVLQKAALEVVKAITLGGILINEIAEQCVPLTVGLREGLEGIASLLNSRGNLCKLRIEKLSRLTVGGGTRKSSA
jgi:hypothetical protein